MAKIDMDQLTMVSRRNLQTADEHWSIEIAFTGPDGLVVYYMEAGDPGDVTDRQVYADRSITIDPVAFEDFSSGPDFDPDKMDRYEHVANNLIDMW